MATKGLREDVSGGKIQGFAPKEIITITATVAWTPTQTTDRAFRVPVACSYFMGTDSGHSAGLVAGAITVINREVTSYTFDSTLELELM